jgi:hypothetical protein
MQQILIQTSVPDSTTGPWGVNRFSALVGLLSSLTDAQGQPLYHVIARNRQADRQGDDVLLSRLAESEVDQLWLFAVEAPTEANAGLTLNDGHGINAFVSRGGALVTAQAPNGLGHSLVRLGGLSLSHQTTNFCHSPRRPRLRPTASLGPIRRSPQ